MYGGGHGNSPLGHACGTAKKTPEKQDRKTHSFCCGHKIYKKGAKVVLLRVCEQQNQPPSHNLQPPTATPKKERRDKTKGKLPQHASILFGYWNNSFNTCTKYLPKTFVVAQPKTEKITRIPPCPEVSEK